MSEALRLANDLDRGWAYKTECAQAAAELRRLAAVEAQRDELLELLDEVRMNFTRDDDLPDGLLPRIDSAIAKAEQEK